MQFDIEIHISITAPDVEATNEEYDKIYDILAKYGYEPSWGEVGPALVSETLE
jgi:hypothetical protein